MNITWENSDKELALLLTKRARENGYRKSCTGGELEDSNDFSWYSFNGKVLEGSASKGTIVNFETILKAVSTPQTPPICLIVNGKEVEVEFLETEIKVGCTTVSHEKLKEICKKVNRA